MPYVDRNEQGRVVGLHDIPQHEGQEYVEGEVSLYFDDRAAILAEYRSLRETYLNRLTGIAVRGDATLAAAAKTMAQGLLDLTDHPSVTAAADGPALKAAVMARYKELVAAAVTAAPGSKAVFDRVSK